MLNWFKREGLSMDLTGGPLVRSIVLFAIPLLVSGFLQQLYSTVDLLFVSNYLGSEASAALGVSTLLVTCVIGLINGLAIGSNVMIAIVFSKGAEEDLHNIVWISLLVGFFGGIVLAGVGFALVPHYVVAMNIPIVSQETVTIYLRTYFMAMVAVAIYNIAVAVSRAAGDSLSPMLAQAVGGAANILFNWLALSVLQLGIGGVVLATFVSNAIAAVLTMLPLARRGILARPFLTKIASCRNMVYEIFRIGIPSGLQALVITFSNVLIQRQIDLLDVDAIAAFSIYFKIELPIYLAIMAVGQAATTFVAQNRAAGLCERAWKGAYVCQMLGILIAFVLSISELTAGRVLFWFFGQDQEVIEYGMSVVRITFPFYFVYSILEVQGAIARGSSRALIPAIITFINICLLRVLLVLALTRDAVSIEAIAFVYPATWVTASLCMLVYVFMLRRSDAVRMAS